MLIGTAGHIDHGKTSLIKRLTGRDTDRLPEEIKRGISIELGYAFVPAGDDVLGFVDVPGHERFVHTMLAGATGIDFALLVVAADDGVMPQTDEHLDILLLLGIEFGAVALTKIDAVSSTRVAEVRAQIGARTRGTPAAAWPVFDVSSVTGDGVDALGEHLLAQASKSAARLANGHFRMAVDRCFTLTGVGTVVTGTVHTGRIDNGASVALVPGPHGALTARVRSLHSQDRQAAHGEPGQRCALALVGLERAEIARGMWVQSPELSAVTERVDAALRLSAREAKPLTTGMTVHLHHGTADAMGRVAVLDGTRVEPGDEALVAITLDRPLAACRGDRFVIRDASARRTIGGGRVLDVTPAGTLPRRGRRAPARLRLLASIRDGTPATALQAWLAQHPVRLPRLADAWNLRADEMGALIEAAGARVAADMAFAAEHWSRLRGEVLNAVDAAHRREPEMPGVEQQKLRRAVAPALDPEAFGAAIDELLGEAALVRRGAFVALPTHKAELGKEQRVRWERIQPLLIDRKFDPPRVRDVARETGIPEVEVRDLLRTVARVGDVTLVALDHFFVTTAVAQLADIAADLSSLHGAARAAEFRDRIGTGRKLAIQILEFFDRAGYTHRVRDDHVVRRENPWR
ncbi:MAG TPA: selenocysteine-specific translation elongation factor [Burkholderiaceae bacterium]|nr:selenocysteine-specific translation elongation factor [Burkholderiaceae bacterium]